MRDRTIYTKEGLQAIIRHIRMYGAILKDEEARLLMLYEAAKDYGAVDARGKRWAAGKTRKQFKFGPLPDFLSTALRAGETVSLPGHQE